MDDTIDIIYCIVDDILKALGHQHNQQQQMTDAEVITTALVAMRYFYGNFERAREILGRRQYIPKMLGKSRFNRRIHALKEFLLSLFEVLAEIFKALNSSSTYIIDSFPIQVCDNIRIPVCKIYQGAAYRGKIASKKRYFYGLKLHLMVTADACPVEFFFTPGRDGDVDALKIFRFDLPASSTVYADKAYTDYHHEDILLEAADIRFLAIRKCNSHRPLPPYVRYLQERSRKMVETAGSLLERMLPKSIHVVTAKGFELKVALFVLALSFSRAF